MKNFLVCLFIFLLILSCTKNDVEFSNLLVSNGISNIVSTNDNIISFLANLYEYNGIPVLCFVNLNGEILKIYPVNNSSIVDVNYDFIKTKMVGNNILLFYDNSIDNLIIERYSKNIFLDKFSFKRNKKSYGSLIQFGINNPTICLKNNLHFTNKIGSEYLYDYFIFNEEVKVIENGVISLGEYFPEFVTIYNHEVYFIIDRKLSKINLKTKEIHTIYIFESNVINFFSGYNQFYILLDNSIFIVENGIVTKSFKLLQDGSNLKAVAILEVTEKFLSVSFKGNNSLLYKKFTIHGNQISEFELPSIIKGNSIILNKKLIYTKSNNLYIKKL